MLATVTVIMNKYHTTYHEPRGKIGTQVPVATKCSLLLPPHKVEN